MGNADIHCGDTASLDPNETTALHYQAACQTELKKLINVFAELVRLNFILVCLTPIWRFAVYARNEAFSRRTLECGVALKLQQNRVAPESAQTQPKIYGEDHSC